MVSEASDEFPATRGAHYLYVADAEAAMAKAEQAGAEKIMDVGYRGVSGNLNSGAKWIAGLTAAMLAASRRQDEQATARAPQTGFQSQGGVGCHAGEKALAALAQQCDVHPNLINQWRARLLEGAADVFGAEPAAAGPAVDVTMLYAKIGELTLANDLLAGALGMSRGSIYYLPRAVPDVDLAVMRRIDELHLLYSFAGSRMLRDLLRQEGVVVGWLNAATPMKRMRIPGDLSSAEHLQTGAGS